ncbi:MULTISPECIES: hypothetical protein [Nitratiruptor]|uniref:Uncharacterized protein n=1 Tax=Nitratiruptor tergarcus DSM 16512 TaxID=1069081 RepID=A0A1W1WRE8_9BACT|nr:MULTISPECIES: hypothetical protein [Nitratiruptor]BCD61389.1 arginine/ornithine antiporter ArcD [Nitratiruptor sp. YY08-13]BCD65323.1 arginine/ornithine antiporter ArcD [Nitratiruptor sp. YY08-26]SMC08884.1 hypothetical protein SAMN05660197_0666 [Nitratiruptor tergarcus DSM 16512]
MFEKLLDKIVSIVFIPPKYPMRFRELMEANRVLVDNLSIDTIPGLKFCRLKLYLIYFILWNLIIIPLALLFHTFLAKLDCHISIILAILFTLLFFGTYKIFENRVKEYAAQKLIKEGWKNYLPHFPYEKYHIEVAQIYKEALDRDIAKHKIEQFIIDKLIESK